jgi:catechol 2,3-dioxygenase-like lactoylglutathione lyase family enzyme
MTRINHVSISAVDIDTAAEFYARLLGARRLPTPDFGLPVAWLALQDTQLHIFQSDEPPASRHHFGAEVDLDRIVAAYRIAEEGDLFEDETFGGRLIGLPGDVVQLYLRDPEGNLVELDAVGASRLPDELRPELKMLEEMRPQPGEHAEARLYIGPDRPAPGPD